MNQKNINYKWLFCILVLFIFTITSCGDPTGTLQVFNLTIQSNGNGTTDPVGTMEINNAVSQDILATPDTGHHFTGWEVVTGSGVKFGNQNAADTTVTLTEEDATIQANFEPDECSLTIIVLGNGTTNPAVGDTPFTVNYGEPVAIEAIPDALWDFGLWDFTSGTCSFDDAIEEQTNVRVYSSEATIRANFTQGQFYLTLTVDGEGTTTPEPNVAVLLDMGVPYNIIAYPETATGWIFDYWEVTSGTATIENPDEADTDVTLDSSSATIQAHFVDDGAPEDYSVNIDQADIWDDNENALSFTFEDAEVNATYYYSIDDAGNGDTDPVTGSGTVASTTYTVSGINVSSLDDSELTLTFHLSDLSGNDGDPVYDTVDKDTTPPVFNDVTHGGIDNYYRQGETITFTVVLDEPGTVTADLSDLDVGFSANQALSPVGGNTYSYTTAALSSNAYEGTYSIAFTATDVFDQSRTSSFLSITIDLTEPAGSFMINTGHKFPLSTTATLNMSITGSPAYMRFGNSSSAVSSADWVSYSASTGQSLSTGTGLKTVYGQFSDLAGNVYQTTDYVYLVKKLTAYDGAANNTYGIGVGISGDDSTVIVGAPLGDGEETDSGSAYMYNGADWGAEMELRAVTPDGILGDNYGYSVAVSSNGRIVAVGVYGYDNLGSSAGAVYVYDTTLSIVQEQVVLEASDGEAGDNFGYSVAVSSDGSVIVVGAYGDDDRGSSAGAAYVYYDPSWGVEEKLLASDGAANDRFGRSVAISPDGSTAVVGAYIEDNANGTNAGSVYVYNGDTWGTQTKVLANGGAASDSFGYCVAVSNTGSIIAVGAYGDDDGGSASGSVYVCSGSSWGTQIKLNASDAAASDNFGRSVALSSDGSTVVVGAYLNDTTAGADAGTAYVYNGINWGTETLITAADGANTDYFGINVSVSSDGSTVVVGAHGDDDDGLESGSAYLIHFEE